MYEKLFFIGGFHRSGSMLLGSILCQNKDIHMEGKSALCQLMWDAQESVERINDFLISNDRTDFDKQYIEEIPKIYYKKNTRKIVIDKNPWWTNSKNINMINKYIDKNFKMIVLYRNPIEIVQSLTRIYKNNNICIDEPIINNFLDLNYSFSDFIYLVNNNSQNNFLFIDYEDLITDTKEKILQIYDFLEIKRFDHSFQNIKKYYLSSDNFIDLEGLYEVRSEIKKRNYSINLDQETYDICKKMNKEIIKLKGLGLC